MCDEPPAAEWKRPQPKWYRCPGPNCTLLCLSGQHFERRPDPPAVAPCASDAGEGE
jgi:hypothetical protein